MCQWHSSNGVHVLMKRIIKKTYPTINYVLFLFQKTGQTGMGTDAIQFLQKYMWPHLT